MNDNSNSKFIATEPIKKDGEKSEKKVWECVKEAFSDRTCIAYWRYPIFSNIGETRKEPDVFILDKELGAIIIEVKGITIDQIKSISGHLWEYEDMYVKSGSPYEQAENQLYAVLAHCEREPILRRKVLGRAIVALPLISRSEWQNRGFDKLACCPPIIFSDDIKKTNLINKIKEVDKVVYGKELSDEQWCVLLSIISGGSVMRKGLEECSLDGTTRSGIMKIIKERMYEIDIQQEKIGKAIPPGPQRIRGIAGSGKTVLLCQKAACMHLKYPEWNIALVFFTRSLYDNIVNLVDKWMRHFTNGEFGYNPDENKNLRVFHTWGAKERLGLYKELCRQHGVKALAVNNINNKYKPNEKFAYACKDLLQKGEITPTFDAILIDEAQDLMVDKEELKYEGKQSFFWMAYQALKPVDEEHPKDKRLIWAYDEAQSLDNLKIPSASEIFGDDPDLKKMVSGSYSGGILKSEIMSKCYRTPGLILTTAHGIGMGLLRKNGMLRGFTNKDDWEKIGYRVVSGSFNPPGQKIILERPEENSPNEVQKYWNKPVVEFNTFATRTQELESIVEKIKYNIKVDKLNTSRDILVIVLGKRSAAELQKYTATFLMERGIKIYIPAALEKNVVNFRYPYENRDKFWHDDAVTISTIHRAKGNEADMIYILGLDKVAENESNVSLRNQVFVAMTRARGWVNISGVGDYPLYQELKSVIESNGRFSFVFKRPEKQELDDEGDI